MLGKFPKELIAEIIIDIVLGLLFLTAGILIVAYIESDLPRIIGIIFIIAGIYVSIVPIPFYMRAFRVRYLSKKRSVRYSLQAWGFSSDPKKWDFLLYETDANSLENSEPAMCVRVIYDPALDVLDRNGVANVYEKQGTWGAIVIEINGKNFWPSLSGLKFGR